MNLDRFATTIQHDRRAAHEERDRATTGSPSTPETPAAPTGSEPNAPAR